MSNRELSEKDTQHLLGQLIPESARRDAVHVAVAPGVAACRLAPGQHVGIAPDGVTADPSATHIGIVDAFLPGPVFPGDRFFIFLYPNTITGASPSWGNFLKLSGVFQSLGHVLPNRGAWFERT